MMGWEHKNHTVLALETPGNMTEGKSSSSGIEALQQLWAAGVDMAHFALDDGDASHQSQMNGKSQAGTICGIQNLSMALKNYGY